MQDIKEVYAAACPFCSGTDIRTVRSTPEMWTTLCWPLEAGCGARTDTHYSSAAALWRWNDRH